MKQSHLLGLACVAGVILLILLVWNFMGGVEPPLPPPAQLVDEVNSAATTEQRVAAARQLIRHGREARREVRSLLQSHSDYEPEVVAPIVQATGKNRDYRSMPLLLDLLDSPDPQVRGQSAVAVQKILGADFGFRANDPPEVRREVVKRMRADYAQALPRMQEYYSDQSQ